MNAYAIKLLLLIFTIGVFSPLSAQTAEVSGQVVDGETEETLIGVNIVVNGESGLGTATDANGAYNLHLAEGRHQILFSFIGYNPVEKVVNLSSGQNLQLNVRMLAHAEQLDIVVVSASLYDKNIEEEMVSVDVISSDIIKNTNSVTLQDAVNKAPGVYFLDGQANMRGGSGFTYGAGSRVMVVVDDQPILTADRGEAQWTFIPMEHVRQIEVIKGASSVLYGASSLNGVIHARTAWPGEKPVTELTLYSGLYGRPQQTYKAWWDSPPLFSGLDFSHRQKFERFDLVAGGHVSSSQTHLLGQYSSRARLSFKTRYRPPKNDRISYGINGNITYNDESRYLIWLDADTNAYLPFSLNGSSTLLPWKYTWIAIDPYLNLFDKSGGVHYFKGRIFNNRTQYDMDENGSSVLYNIDYRYVRKFFRDINLTAGFAGYPFITRDDRLGDHDGFSGGTFIQLDSKFMDRLTVNAGARIELYQLDSADLRVQPIFKAGLNYAAGPRTNLRASYGQGYRFPSLVELYANTQVGPMFIYANPELKPENGWNAEFGVKQTLSTGEFKAWADAALYWTEYFDMTEFLFGNNFGPFPGFKSLNNSRARMAGLELELQGNGLIGGFLPVQFIGGYNYVYPADLGADSSNNNIGTYLGNWLEGFGTPDSTFTSTLLKYRFRHMFRIDAQSFVGPVMIGINVNFYGFMDRIDEVFEEFGIPPGIEEFRNDHNSGSWIVGVRAGYRFSENSMLTFLVQNIGNTEYALRVGKLDKPRNYSLQYRLNL